LQMRRPGTRGRLRARQADRVTAHLRVLPRGGQNGEAGSRSTLHQGWGLWPVS
jgi:hypothetical protein